jgi:hypothetical protein
VNVCDLVDDVETSIDFYIARVGFELLSSAAPAFADVRRGALLDDPSGNPVELFQPAG